MGDRHDDEAEALHDAFVEAEADEPDVFDILEMAEFLLDPLRHGGALGAVRLALDVAEELCLELDERGRAADDQPRRPRGDRRSEGVVTDRSAWVAGYVARLDGTPCPRERDARRGWLVADRLTRVANRTRRAPLEGQCPTASTD